MINYKKGKVRDIIKEYNGCTEILVSVEGQDCRAINYDSLTGKVKPGDEVLLNTTAVDLGLGSGGFHFVVSVNDGENILPEQKEKGHIMKLRYTPLQFSVLSVEEQDSPYHDIFNDFKGLRGMPVIIGELHSMLLPAVFNIKRTNPAIRVSYIMTDGGALPLNFSWSVRYLKEKGLIEGTVTFGQAFGGDFEAVNVYTALIAAREVLKADAAVVTMGPGITGTGTKYGFSGIEQGGIIDAVNTLEGRPVFIPRISFADRRERHYGISHHSITVLKEVAKTRAEVVLPGLAKEKSEYIWSQIKDHGIDAKHTVVQVGRKDSETILKNILHYGVKVTTMGRGLDEEKEFFLTAGAAGYYCASSL
ncbi:DUF3866 family protein [Thermoanaerobacterium sp. DL9XJH110]|uniref:DUF3866 family protein n=1 Tax=Thermoanaerobacterium sp. DL9XJH110 TaxID=3386643 RepID=UPI003BB76D1C